MRSFWQNCSGSEAVTLCFYVQEGHGCMCAHACRCFLMQVVQALTSSLCVSAYSDELLLFCKCSYVFSG